MWKVALKTFSFIRTDRWVWRVHYIFEWMIAKSTVEKKNSDERRWRSSALKFQLARPRRSWAEIEKSGHERLCVLSSTYHPSRLHLNMSDNVGWETIHDFKRRGPRSPLGELKNRAPNNCADVWSHCTMRTDFTHCWECRVNFQSPDRADWRESGSRTLDDRRWVFVLCRPSIQVTVQTRSEECYHGQYCPESHGQVWWPVDTCPWWLKNQDGQLTLNTFLDRKFILLIFS